MTISNISFGRSPATIDCRKITKEGLEKAESLLRKAQNKYGRPNSATYLQMKVNAHKNNPKYSEISEKLLKNADEYSDCIKYRPYASIAQVLQGRKETKPIYGDCGECATAIRNEFLLEHGQPTINIVMEVRKKDESFSNHAFNLSNIKKGINPNDPKTWGKEAIVVDLWSGIAMKSEDAIKHFEKIFDASPQTDKISFKLMPTSEDSIQRSILKHFGLEQTSNNPYRNIPRASLYN